MAEGRASASFDREVGPRAGEDERHLALAAAEMGTWRYRVATEENALDAGMARLLGLPPGVGTVSREEFLATVHPDDRAAVAEAFARGGRAGADVDLEFRVVRPDGATRWLKDRGKSLPGPDGRPAALVGAAVDITERRLAEEALRRSEERYRKLFASIDQGFCTIEVLFDGGRAVDYVFLEVNPAFARVTGLGDAVGKRMRELAPGHEEHWFATYGRVALGGGPARFEAEAAALGRWYNVYAYRVGNPEDRHVAILFEDVTARRGDEAALRESEERFRAIVEQATDYAIFTTDPEGRIETWPPGAQAIFGRAEDEAVGMPFHMTYTPEDRAAGVPERELAQARGEGAAPNVRWHLRADGSRVFIDGVARARLGADRAFLGLLKVGRDDTERQRAEEEQRATAARQAFLLRLSDALRPLSDAAAVQAEATRLLREEVGAGWCYYVEWDEAGTVGTVVRENARGGLPSMVGDHDVSDAPAFTDLLRSGRTLNVPDFAASPLFTPRVVARYTGAGINAVLGASLVKDGRLRSTLSLADTAPRAWSDDAVALVGEVAERTWAAVERARAEAALRASEASLQRRVAEATAEVRDLSRRLLLAQEEERRRLALELHDEVGQVLTGLGMELGAGAATDAERLGRARWAVAELTEQVRQLAMELRPAALDAYGLLPALRWHLGRYERRTGVRVDLFAEGIDRRFPEAVEIAAYRIVQEALTNVARHSGARGAAAHLLADGGVLTVVVRDRGRGFDKGRVAPGIGLGGMRERAELLGGTLEVDAAPGEGVSITAELPLEDPAERPEG